MLRAKKRKVPGPSSSSQQSAPDSDNDLDELDEDNELLSLMPKRIRDADNIINIAQSTRNLSRDQICLLFIEIAKRPDQNYEFDLAFWLQQFAALSIEPNFSEAAIVLVYAGQIYCRKIDMLYDFIMRIHTQTGKAVSLCEQTKRAAAEIETALANNEPVPKKKRVVKKKQTCLDKNRIITTPFELFGGDMTPGEIRQSDEPLCEKVVLKHKERIDDTIKYFNSCERLKRKLMILKILKQARRRLRSKRPIFNCEFPVQSDNHDIPNYANEELVDIDDEIVAGTRRDYFVFMGMINRKKHTLNLVHNFNKDNDCVNSSQTVCTGATLLPPEYVERVYNVKLRNPKHYYDELRKEYELWKDLGPTQQDERNRRCILIAYQKAVKLLDEKNILGHMRTSNVITETQYNEAITRLMEEHASNDRTLSPIENFMDTTVSLNKTRSTMDSGIGTSINESNITFDESISLNQTNDLSHSTLPIIDLDNMDDVYNSTHLDAFNQSLSVNILLHEQNRISKFSPAMIVEKLVNSELRISVDEGISCTSRTSSPLPRMSDLDPITRMLLSPKVQLVDICDSFTDSTKIGLRIKLNQPDNSIFYIENKKLHDQCFNNNSLPENPIPTSQVPINLNFLSLPEKMLRRKCKFALPNEFRAMKIRKTNESMLSKSGDVSPISDSGDFMGFDDIVVSNPDETSSHQPVVVSNPDETSSHQPVVVSNPDETSSHQPVVYNSPNRVKNVRSFSQDSGLGYCSSPPHNIVSDENQLQQVRNKKEKSNKQNNSSGVSKSMFDDYDSENNIVERITEWYSHLAPILKASKERSYFDIHAYGSEIINTFPVDSNNDTEDPARENGDIISFEELMSTKQKDCTARYFLSMLQLANNGNVEIIPPPNRCSTKLTEPSELKLRLLSREIRSEGMEEECNFDNYEPSSKKRRVQNKTPQTINPIQKIMKTCNKLQDRNIRTPTASTSRDSEKILKMIEMYKNSPRFNRIDSQQFTPDEVISIASRFNPNNIRSTAVNSEFGESGFQSMSNLSLTIGDG